jgi:hypothetical protein
VEVEPTTLFARISELDENAVHSRIKAEESVSNVQHVPKLTPESLVFCKTRHTPEVNLFSHPAGMKCRMCHVFNIFSALS